MISGSFPKIPSVKRSSFCQDHGQSLILSQAMFRIYHRLSIGIKTGFYMILLQPQTHKYGWNGGPTFLALSL
jgi:hypothetical protein